MRVKIRTIDGATHYADRVTKETIDKEGGVEKTVEKIESVLHNLDATRFMFLVINGKKRYFCGSSIIWAEVER